MHVITVVHSASLSVPVHDAFLVQILQHLQKLRNDAATAAFGVVRTLHYLVEELSSCD